ncbi:unnamed protein product [Pylaiella littoralis]
MRPTKEDMGLGVFEGLNVGDVGETTIHTEAVIVAQRYLSHASRAVNMASLLQWSSAAARHR